MAKAFTANENDLFGPEDEQQILMGTVGHEGIDEDSEIITDGIYAGTTIVNVTLYKGRDPATEIKPGVAQGYRIKCQVMGPLHHVPETGTRVMIAIPHGMTTSPGAGVILGTLGKTPSTQFSKTRTVFDFGDQNVIFRGKSVTIQNNTSPAIYVSVGDLTGPQGITIVNDKGCGVRIENKTVGLFASDAGDAKSLVQIEHNAISIGQKSCGMFMFKDGQASLLSNGPLFLIGKQVMLGIGATVTTPVVHGLSGIAGIASTTVFVAP